MTQNKSSPPWPLDLSIWTLLLTTHKFIGKPLFTKICCSQTIYYGIEIFSSMVQFVTYWTNVYNANKNNNYYFVILLPNLKSKLLCQLRNNLFGNSNVINPPFYDHIVISKNLNICDSPYVNPIPNLFIHQQFELTNQPILLQYGDVP